MRSRLLLAACLSALAVTGCATPGVDRPAQSAAAANANWARFVDGFTEGYFRHNPAFAIYQGRHEYDGKMADWTPAGLKASCEFLKSSIAAAQAFDPASLSEEQRFERDYLMARARGDLFWLDTAEQPFTNPSYYLGAGLDPSVYVTRPYASADVRLKAYIAYLKAIPAAAQQIRKNLRTPMPLSFIDYGKSAFGGFAEYYPGDGRKAFAEVQDRALQAELDRSSRAAARAMKGLADWLETLRPSATQDFALGPERFSQMLRATEMVDLPLSELEAIGEADLRRNQDALRQACARYAPGATMQACMDKMGAHKPEGGVVEEARRQLTELKAFVAAKDLVTIPGTEEAQVEEAPPYNRQNFAYIDIPGPFEKGLPSVYYIAPPDPAWSPEVQAGFVPGKADLLFTSVHEVWPGHFLNFLHSNRSPFTFGKLFVGYAYAEGWAHYTEEMMWDAGLGNGDPETHVGQLSNALLRDCRYLSAIGMHSGRMTQEQSYRLFRDQCYQDEGNTRQQSARGTYDPAYLNYTMGKLMIRKLRDDWTASRGGRRGWKEFHDRFLSYGGPPIPLVRQQMMGGDAKAAF
ncbi:DUF885 domain-containing protein [Allosphingosinicella indica]|uniref:Uncharacterized conserved protein, DUF885 familyt n=1 Tax=Allosphingosinicella indica TaxID=941907 RepID=A0A1X7FZ76_9SPHN|nr:DUF885 domain-containing protein [Allosphingosinicella indica]SMF61369.1 Uncharacterized conserved protein, DUF885 familyt [Allosphingosinicella indica]